MDVSIRSGVEVLSTHTRKNYGHILVLMFSVLRFYEYI